MFPMLGVGRGLLSLCVANPAPVDPGSRVQGRVGPPASIARTTRARPAECVPATCVGASRTLTSSFFVMSVTWPFTHTASALPSAPFPKRMSGEWMPQPLWRQAWGCGTQTSRLGGWWVPGNEANVVCHLENPQL